MSERTIAQKNQPFQPATNRTGGILQRKCACGNHTPTGGECAECTKKKGILQRKLTIGASNDPLEREADRIANQVLAAPIHPDVTGAPRRIQRLGVQPTTGQAQAPASVNQVLASPGRALEPVLRADMEQRFGYDFSRVRVHCGTAAEQSARDVNASAYTVGHNIVFSAGRFAQGTHEERSLIAHELTHVVQQSGSDGIHVDQGGLPPLVLQRKSSSEVSMINDLLSYGLFDWAVTETEAVEALTLLKGLPRIEQAEFVSDPKYMERLQDNLPADRRAELETIKVDVVGIIPPTDVVEAMIDKLSYGLFDWAITDSEAIAALELLKTLSGERLAVALRRIDYARLMENLPQDRHPELIDLLAQALGTSGTLETSKKREPGTSLRSLEILTDHNVMRENKENWSSKGKPYPIPEWTITPEGETKSAPISHTMDQAIEIELGFDVAPINAPDAPVKIEGKGSSEFLNFDFSGTQRGGIGKRQRMTSSGKLPSEVKALRNQSIDWKIRWNEWEHELGRTGPIDIYTTFDKPRNPDEVTTKRMDKSVELAGSSPSPLPHDVVKNIMFRWTTFNLDVRYANEWDLADDMARGAQCIDLVRFVQSVIGTVGLAGTANAVIVWAHPAAPLTAIEAPWDAGGGMSSVDRHPTEPSWSAWLLDGNLRPNNFEAALKFTADGRTLYYPGGVASVMENKEQVLRVFNCLAWIRQVDDGKYEIMNVPTSYRASACAVGERHNW